MDNLGSEINQKMRSAVKAKLLELGSGYIDDELPDYVMIMVANKRPKVQMKTDLELFLGAHTDLFVTWLHEVLQKLEEVTLPAPNLTTKKHKSGRKDGKEDADINSKKGKKSAKKDKKSKSSRETSPNSKTDLQEQSTSSAHKVPVVNSITDFFAEDLLQKAKKTLATDTEAAAQIKKGKGKRSDDEVAENSDKETNEFNIPSISEITSTTGSAVVSVNRHKDLQELAELQKKIIVAKKHLRQTGELEGIESEDEDFLRLNEESSNDGSINHEKTQRRNSSAATGRAKSPIVFDINEKSAKKDTENDPADVVKRRRFTPPPLFSAAVQIATNSVLNIRNTGREREKERDRDRDRNRERNRERENGRDHERDRKPQQNRSRSRSANRPRRSATRSPLPIKRPVHERLGMRHSSRDGGVRATRARSASRPRQSSLERERERNNERKSRDSRSTARENRPSNETRRSSVDDGTQIVRRVGSRIIVAPAKPVVESDDEDFIDKPVNSVVKITPRPTVPLNKQPCKNLLLRAVKEAQRDTIIAQKQSTAKSAKSIKKRLGAKTDDRTLLKRTRERLKQSSSYANRRGENIFIEMRNEQQQRDQSDHIEIVDDEPKMKSIHIAVTADEDEEYVPESVSNLDKSYEIYIPQAIHNPRSASDKREKTQFVVTMNDDVSEKYQRRQRSHSRHSHSESPLPQVSSSSSATRHNGNGSVPSSTTGGRASRSRVRRDLREILRANEAKTHSATTKSKSPSSPRIQREKSVHNSRSPTRTCKTPPLPRRSELIEFYSKPKEVNKIIIKNDTDDEDSSPLKNTQENTRAKLKRRHKGESTDTKRSLTPPLPPKKQPTLKAKTTSKQSTTKTSHSKRDVCDVQLEKREHDKREHDKREHDKREHDKRQNVSPPRSSQQKRGKHEEIVFDLDKERERERERERDRERERNIEYERERGRVRNSSVGDRSRSKERERDRERERERDGERSHARDKVRSRSQERSNDRARDREREDESRKIYLSTTESKNKFDNIPPLNSIDVGLSKPKERCKYHPNCNKKFCEYFHPTAVCMNFPNCKYADKCMYSHPQCRYDLHCTNSECHYSHSGPRDPRYLTAQAPPLSSHVVPVQNYKSISVSLPAPGASTTMCKYFPGCSKIACTFFHPKPCHFGKNCINKLECNFYHPEVQSANKFRWVAKDN